MTPGSSSVKRGVALAALAAVLFGATAPLVKLAAAGTSALVSGALLYLGAALGALLLTIGRRRPVVHELLVRKHLVRLVVVALVGGALGPALLVMGLARTDAATASLLLTLEAPFTLILALVFLREAIGSRVVLAMLLILGGAVMLVGPATAEHATWAGAALVAAATAAWAVDNLLSRALAEHDASSVVAIKGLLGSAASAATATAMGAARPAAGAALALLALGAVGYGVSLQLYLRAQRQVGAARTASVFAAAPFVGAAAAFALGAPFPGWPLAVAAVLMGAGVWLHASERHGHPHTHDPVEHDHPHTHDDGHHDHTHDPMPAGPHSHPHHHAAVVHEHEHSEDLHHRHTH